jgi:stress response protein YsnF
LQNFAAFLLQALFLGQTFKPYEQRVNKQSRKTGEVTIDKNVKTQTFRVAVPVEKE